MSDCDVPFFRCASCGAVVMGASGANPARLSGNPRRPDVSLPYAENAFAPACCGAPMERLVPAHDGGARLSYDVAGGFDMNALRVFWSGEAPEWIALKTFTGMQLKYVLPNTRQPVVFALADEDAYAYCDEDPCRACTFHCKRGFALYSYDAEGGLAKTPVHQGPLVP